MKNSKNISKSQITNKKVANKLYINLLECSDAVKTASQNGTLDFQIDENLKSETRRSYKLINIFILIILANITYCISYLTPFIIIIPILIYFSYIKRHPSLQLAKIWLFEGANVNQIRVINNQIFSHIISLKYIIIFGLIILSLSVLHYFYNFSEYVIHIQYFDFILEILKNNYSRNVITFYNKILNNIDISLSINNLYFVFGYSNFREFSANLNYVSILIIVFANIIQIIRRPQ
jgi:hypothetical protein